MSWSQSGWSDTCWRVWSDSTLSPNRTCCLPHAHHLYMVTWWTRAVVYTNHAGLCRFVLHVYQMCVFTWTSVGAVSAVHRCVLDVPGVLTDAFDHSMMVEILSLLEKITLLLLGVLYGDQNMEENGTLTAAPRHTSLLLGCHTDSVLSETSNA